MKLSALLAATFASLVVTLTAGYAARTTFIDAGTWVTHTDSVKLALDQCEIALLRGDREALAEHLAVVEQLTLDNPRQQRESAQVMLLLDQGKRETLEDRFQAMQSEEDRLMVHRLRRLETRRRWGAAGFLLGALLSLAFGVGSALLLRAQRKELTGQKALLEAIIDTVDEGVLATDASRNVIAMNAVARRMLGDAFPRDRVPDDWRPYLDPVREDGSPLAAEDGAVSRALRGLTTDALVYSTSGTWISASGRPLRDAAGRVVAAVATLRDITNQRAESQRLRDLSLTDELTGLLNRRGFTTLASARMQSMRSAKTPAALLYADLNGLKRINDDLGHEHGDQAIQDAAHALSNVFRDGDIVARLGGDEYVALLPGFSPAAQEALLDRIASAVAHRAEREHRPYRLSVSLGVTVVDWDKSPALEDLLAEADRAMYARKRERASLRSLRIVHDRG